MKRLYFIIAITLLNLLPCTAQWGKQVHWEANGLRFEQQDGYDRIVYGDRYTQETGCPELPVVRQSWVIPMDAEVQNIAITASNRQRLPGNFRIYPAQEPVPVGETMKEKITANATVYAQTTPYPEKQVRLVENRYMMGYHIVTVEISPLSYIPATDELYLSDIHYQLQCAPSANEPPKPAARQSRLRYEMVRHHVQSLVENPEDVENHAPQTTVIEGRLNSRAVTLSRMSVAEDGATLAEGTIPDYIIITNETLKPVFQTLADWKTQKGIPARIMTVEEINKEYAGSDTPDRIRAFLLDLREKIGEGLFVLLGGDIDIAPAKMAKRNNNPLYPTDFYYNVLDATWNPMNNDLDIEKPDAMGVSENSFLFYLGRAPVENAEEAETFISKVLKYEKASSSEADYTYLNNYLAVDGFIQEYANGDLHDGAMTQIEGYFDDIIPPTVHRWYLFDHFLCTKDDHTPYTCRKDCGEELNKENFTACLNTGGNSGLNHFHFVYHMDHSSPTCLGTSSKDKGQYFTNDNASALTNGDYLFLLMSGGCQPATFSQDCVGERLLNNPNGGAVAFIGNSDIGWSSEYAQFKYFMNSLYDEKNRKSSYCLSIPFQNSYLGCNKNLPYWRPHLFGDPEMPVWTAAPQKLNVRLAVSEKTDGMHISMQVQNLPAGQDAWVCLRKGTECYLTDQIEDTNTHTYVLNTRTAGTVEATVTVHDFRPYEETINVGERNNPPLAIQSVTIADSGIGCEGNGDGHMDAGETVRATVVFGGATPSITGLKRRFVLSCNSDEITMLQDTTEITTQSNRPISVPFRFKINAECQEHRADDWTPLRFEVSALPLHGEAMPILQDGFNAEIFAPEIELLKTSQLIWQKNAFTFNVSIKNTGNAEAIGITTLFTPKYNYIKPAPIPIQKNYSLMNIQPNETKELQNPILYTLSADYTTGMPLEFEVNITDQYRKSWTYQIDPVTYPNTIAASNITVQADENAIELKWEAQEECEYNVYRSATETGTYEKLNLYPLAYGYFKDENLPPYTTYYYKVTAVNEFHNESPMGDAVKGWTTCPLMPMFPVVTQQDPYMYYSWSSVTSHDINYDGQRELFSTQLSWSPNKTRIIALGADGTELFNEDGDVTQYNGFGETDGHVRMTPAVADLKSDGTFQLITATRELYDGINNPIRCFSLDSLDENGLPILRWQRASTAKYLYPPIIADMDHSNDGANEIVLTPCEKTGRILILNPDDGSILQEIGKAETKYGTSAIADLDGNGTQEIIIGLPDGVYIWNADGTDFAGTNPVYANTQYWFASSPVVCDIDNDGSKEILLVAKNAAQTEGTVFALETNGELAAGWNFSQKVPTTQGEITHDLSVGDLDGDGYLEVAVIGIQDGMMVPNVFKHDGTLLFAKETGSFAGDIATIPILADVDGDAEVEILFNTKGTEKDQIFALNPDGTDVPGFPLATDYGINNAIYVEDVDGDGLNELLAVANNAIYGWETNGLVSRIEWGSERGNSRNTGEYGVECRPMVVSHDTAWDGETPCGNLIVRSGNLTLNAHQEMTLSPGSRIIVCDGGTLTIDGATVSHAHIWAREGSHVSIKNGGIVRLSDSGALKIEKGASLEQSNGRIILEE